MKALLIIAAVCTITTRTYWNIDVDTFSQNGSYHTHVSITGYVNYVACESDGDLHIRIVATAGVKPSTALKLPTVPFFVAECIPSLPCARPTVGTLVTVKGITRRDPEHSWWEVHPIESITTH